MAKQIPVYLFVGQLESGKTKFIQETMEDPQFDSGDKTLLLVCEDGEIEYDPSRFAFGGVHVAQIEDKSELTQENLAALAERSGCGRVLVEYNGMWLLQDLYDAMPDNWVVFQCLATADGTTIKTYAGDNAMRALLLDTTFIIGTITYFGTSYAISAKYCLLISAIAIIFCLPGQKEFHKLHTA